MLADNIGGTVEAAAPLAAHRHRRIAYLADRADIYSASDRLLGFREGSARAAICREENLVAVRAPTPASVADAVNTLLSGPDPTSAVIAGNDRVAVHMARASDTPNSALRYSLRPPRPAGDHDRK
jgi:LacI family transcriptional regulator